MFRIFTKNKVLDTGEEQKVLDPPKYIGFGVLLGLILVMVWIVASTHARWFDPVIATGVVVFAFFLWGWIGWLANRKPLNPGPELFPWEIEPESERPERGSTLH